MPSKTRKRKKQIKKKIVNKKIIRRKPAKKARPAKKITVLRKKAAEKITIKKAAKPNEGVIGEVTHYFPKVSAAVVKLKKTPLSVGDTVKIKGHTTDFTQKVTSIQINHVVVNTANKGDEIGLKVDSRVRQGDLVYKA